MLLTFDVGNTNIVLGLFEGTQLVADWRISSDRTKTADEYGLLLEQLFQCYDIKRRAVSDIIISSVVPNLLGTLKQMIEKYFHIQPYIVGAGLKTGMPIRYENPKEVGADRIVNAVAAYQIYGGPSVIVDFGTATTFCVITAKGEYLGGAITPGVGISSNALIDQTAQLPKVEMVFPTYVIGKNTVNAIQSGILYGYCDLIDGMVTRIIAEIGEKEENVQVIATGGLAELFKEHTKTITIVDPYLTLKGLQIIYEKNKR